jgi:hypothetical protein
MIAAYADGFRVLKDEKYRLAAEKAALFLLENLRTKDGRLLRTYRAGGAKLPAYVEDYAFLAHGLLRLHRATGAARWAREAQALVDRLIADFEDKEDGGFFFTASDHEQLLARAKDPFDNALPSANSMAILDLIEIYRITRQAAYLDRAGKALTGFGTVIVRVPAALPMMLVGLGQFLDERPDSASKELVAGAGPDRADERVVAAKLVSNVGNSEEIAQGAEFEVTATITIKPGWHIYANPTGVAELNPTKFEVHPGSRKLFTIEKLVYPTGVEKVLASSGKEKVALYEGEVEIKAVCRVAEDAKPEAAIFQFQMTYQACNDQLCKAPATLEWPLSVRVKRKQ